MASQFDKLYQEKCKGTYYLNQHIDDVLKKYKKRLKILRISQPLILS